MWRGGGLGEGVGMRCEDKWRESGRPRFFDSNIVLIEVAVDDTCIAGGEGERAEGIREGASAIGRPFSIPTASIHSAPVVTATSISSSSLKHPGLSCMPQATSLLETGERRGMLSSEVGRPDSAGAAAIDFDFKASACNRSGVRQTALAAISGNKVGSCGDAEESESSASASEQVAACLIQQFRTSTLP
mgnify:FL=1